MRLSGYVNKIESMVRQGDEDAMLELAYCMAINSDMSPNDELSGRIEDILESVDSKFEEFIIENPTIQKLTEYVDREDEMTEEAAEELNNIIFKKAVVYAEQYNIAEAQCMLGEWYAEEEFDDYDLVKAAMWYKKSAEQGFAHAQYRYGMCSCLANGVEGDVNIASYWFSKAAEQGYDVGQFFLAKSYAVGIGVEKDEKKAFEWYEKSAMQNLANAQFALAGCYEKGLGVEQNMELAKKWYELAKENGYDYEDNNKNEEIKDEN